MAVNKVIYDGNTLIDLTSTTAVASDVAQGKYFVNISGELTLGTATGGSGDGYVWQDAQGYVHLSDEQGTQTIVEPLSVTVNGTYTASTGHAYSPVTVNVSGGGGDSWSWMGKNPSKVKTCLDEKKYLEDTAFATWTPSTTSATLVSSASLEAYTPDFSTYDYVLIQRFHTHFEYETAVNNSVSDYFYETAHFIYGRPTNLSTITDDTVGGVLSACIGGTYGLFYKNGSGTNAYSTQSYGVYVNTYTSPTVSTSSITPKTLAVTARCSSTYFSTTAASAVDQANSYYEQRIELWRVDRKTTPSGATEADIRDMWLNGF